MEIVTFIFYFFLLMWCIGAIALIIYLYRKNYIPYPVHFHEQYYQDLPSDLSPGELSLLMYRKIDPQVLTTTVLNLIKKGVLKLEYRENDYYFAIDRDYHKEDLTRSENVMKEFFVTVSNQDVFSLSKLDDYCKSKSGKNELLFQYELWKKVVRKESSQKSFFEDKQGYVMVKAMKNLGILLLIANFAGGYHLITGYGIIFPILFLPFFFSILYKRNAVYEEEYAKWLAFASYLEHLKEFPAPNDIHSFTMSAIVLKRIDALYQYKPDDKSLAFVSALNATLQRCYRRAYLSGNRSINDIWSLK